MADHPYICTRCRQPVGGWQWSDRWQQCRTCLARARQRQAARLRLDARQRLARELAVEEAEKRWLASQPAAGQAAGRRQILTPRQQADRATAEAAGDGYCLACHQRKPADNFTRQASAKSGLATYCRDCWQAYRRHRDELARAIDEAGL